VKTMIAKVDFPYRGRSLSVGERFEALDEHVEVFTLIGHARVEDAPSTGQTYDTRAVTARGSRRAKAKGR